MTSRFTISLPDDDLARIDALADKKGITRSELVRDATARYLLGAHAEEREAKRHEAGEHMMRHIDEIRRMPAKDDRPTLEILREMRGPLDEREPWEDVEDIP